MTTTTGRDNTWDALRTVAQRMSKQYFELLAGRDASFDLVAHRRRAWRRFEVVEGLALEGTYFGAPVIDRPGAEPPTRFEAVRRRGLLSSQWHEIRPVNDAAADIGAELRRWAYALRAGEDTRLPPDDRRPPPA